MELKNAITVICSVIIGVVIVEACAVWQYPAIYQSTSTAKFWRDDHVLGWFHVSNVKGRFSHIDFDVEVKHNQQGLRDSEWLNQKKRVLVLGDSFAWGYGVEEEDRFTELIESETGWEMINAGVNGWGTVQQYLWVRERAWLYQPELVVVLFHWNDFMNNACSEQRWKYSPYFQKEEGQWVPVLPVPEITFRQKVMKKIEGESYVVDALVRFFSGTPVGENQAEVKLSEAEVDELTAVLFQNIEKKTGVELVVFSIPWAVEYEDRLAKIASEAGVEYYPLNEFFEGKEDVTFPHDAHWNEAGNVITANAIQQILEGRL